MEGDETLMNSYIHPEIRTHFRKWSATTNVEHIMRIWTREGFRARQRPATIDSRAAWTTFERTVNWRDPDHLDRALRVIEALVIHDDWEALAMHRSILALHSWDLDARRRMTKVRGILEIAA